MVKLFLFSSQRLHWTRSPCVHECQQGTGGSGSAQTEMHTLQGIMCMHVHTYEHTDGYTHTHTHTLLLLIMLTLLCVRPATGSPIGGVGGTHVSLKTPIFRYFFV